MRGAVVLVEEGKVALIERKRSGRTYFLFPGGAAERGETPEAAAAREVYEELGLEVRIGPLVAVVEFEGQQQYYYLATRLAGTFGTGEGDELGSSSESQAGSYRPVWLRIDDLEAHDVRPRVLAQSLASIDPTRTPDVLYASE